ncbi:MAG TPA: transglutaminase family protein [Geobacteraceae bacterium]|nr:transglutaminase family protein [Geobacteraceae bacterium]
MKAAAAVMFLLAAISGTASAKTLILEGQLASTILMTQQIGFEVDKPIDTLSFRFAIPTKFSNLGVNQEINSLSIDFQPEPAKVEDEADSFGNSFKKVTWNRLKRDASIKLQFEVKLRSEIAAMASRSTFPLKNLSKNETFYLKPTEMVQSDAKDIEELAKTLTEGAATEYQAVSSVLNFIADNIKYSYNPQKYDALYTLANRSGNCQNFAHISMALLRAAGIPSRIVGGISLKEQWKVPIDSERSVVQGMGQGGHAWMEVYFPDLGWLSYDPQQSRQFTSSRHIKQTHGLDSQDVNDTWRAAPYLPKYSETIDAKFLDDVIDVRLKSSDGEPRPYLVSNAMSVKKDVSITTSSETPQVVTPPLAVTIPPAASPPVAPAKKPSLPEKKFTPPPPKVKTPARSKKPDAANLVEFGNIEFPNLVDTFRVNGASGTRVLDKETSEYVTSTYVYAQAVKVENEFSLDRVSLAMHKFGGDGTVFLDFVSDDKGKPSLTGLRSFPVFLDRISKKPGYYWVDFNFNEGPRGPVVPAGKYWIVLRHSGDAILNWFYIPGKPYSGGDDTRSTAKGYLWEDILNYDFVFRVRGTKKVTKAKVE